MKAKGFIFYIKINVKSDILICIFNFIKLQISIYKSYKISYLMIQYLAFSYFYDNLQLNLFLSENLESGLYNFLFLFVTYVRFKFYLRV